MSSNKTDSQRTARKSWKQQAKDVASANMNIVALLRTAKDDFAKINKLVTPELEGMKLIITPGRRKLQEALERIEELSGRWEALHIRTKEAETGKIKSTEKPGPSPKLSVL